MRIVLRRFGIDNVNLLDCKFGARKLSIKALTVSIFLAGLREEEPHLFHHLPDLSRFQTSVARHFPTRILSENIKILNTYILLKVEIQIRAKTC